jgi:hypothetical protein
MRAPLLVLLIALTAMPASAQGADAAPGGGVRVSDGAGARQAPCPAIDASDPLAPQGGCKVDMASRDVAIVIRTVVGDMHFGTCSYEHDMLVDGAGRTYLVGITSGGPNPCNDMGVCDHENAKPWRGRIESGPDGRLAHVVDACFDTCMGQFVGEMRLGLERVDGRWVQTADRALAGDSGYQIDGGWDVTEGDLDIRPSGSASGEAAGAWLTGEPVGWPI